MHFQVRAIISVPSNALCIFRGLKLLSLKINVFSDPLLPLTETLQRDPKLWNMEIDTYIVTCASIDFMERCLVTVQ